MKVNTKKISIVLILILLVICSWSCGSRNEGSNMNEDIKTEQTHLNETCEEKNKKIKEKEIKSSGENIAESEKKNINHVTEKTDSKESLPEKSSKPAVTPDISEKKESEIKPAVSPANDKPCETEINKIWVVDKPAVSAWDEEVDDLNYPVYEITDYWWIRFDDERGVVRYYDKEEWKIVRSSDPHARQNGNDYEKRLAGYKKKVIHHPAAEEEGHWEYK